MRDWPPFGLLEGISILSYGDDQVKPAVGISPLWTDQRVRLDKTAFRISKRV